MESQPQNPEFKINPENFHPCCLRMAPWKTFYEVSQGNQNL